MAAESSVYLSGDSFEEIYELLEEGFLDDDVDFNKELDAVISTEEKMCVGKNVSSRGLKRIQLRKMSRKLNQKNKKNADRHIWIYEYSEKMCRFMDDLCLPKDTRKRFSSFDFSPDDALALWAVVEKFHRNAENCYSHF